MPGGRRARAAGATPTRGTLLRARPFVAILRIRGCASHEGGTIAFGEPTGREPRRSLFDSAWSHGAPAPWGLKRACGNPEQREPTKGLCHIRVGSRSCLRQRVVVEPTGREPRRSLIERHSCWSHGAPAPWGFERACGNPERREPTRGLVVSAWGLARACACWGSPKTDGAGAPSLLDRASLLLEPRGSRPVGFEASVREPRAVRTNEGPCCIRVGSRSCLRQRVVVEPTGREPRRSKSKTPRSVRNAAVKREPPIRWWRPKVTNSFSAATATGGREADRGQPRERGEGGGFGDDRDHSTRVERIRIPLKAGGKAGE